MPMKEIVMPYSDNLFCNATIEWLINMDQVHFIDLDRSCYMTVLQPISALKHPSFQKMVNIASRAMTSVKIPNQKATCATIIETFKSQMRNLQTWLLVSTILIFNFRVMM